jgi:hypothetical protein
MIEIMRLTNNTDGQKIVGHYLAMTIWRNGPVNEAKLNLVTMVLLSLWLSCSEIKNMLMNKTTALLHLQYYPKYSFATKINTVYGFVQPDNCLFILSCNAGCSYTTIVNRPYNFYNIKTKMLLSHSYTTELNSSQ